MRSKLARILALFLLSGCGPEGGEASLSKDLASDLGVIPGSMIYYRDAWRIAQAACPATGARTRVRCNLSLRHVSTERFVLEARDLPKLDADEAAAKTREIKVRFDYVEVRIAELLASTPDTNEVVQLKVQIAAENNRIAELETQIAGLDDQIARIKSLLASGQGSADLAIQLVSLERNADIDKGTREQRLGVLRGLQSRLIEIKGSGRTDGDFRDMVAWRDSLVVEWTAAQAEHQKAIDERSRLTRVLNYVFEDQIALPIEIDEQSAAFGELKAVVAELDGVFERAALADGNGSRDGWYAAIRRGSFHIEENDDPARLAVAGWEHRQGQYKLFLNLSGFPDLKQNCLSRVGDVDPDLNTRSTEIEAVSCDGATGKPFGPTKTCSWTNFHDNLVTNRRFRIDLTVKFLSPSRIDYEFIGNCYALNQSQWVFSRSERGLLSFLN